MARAIAEYWSIFILRGLIAMALGLAILLRSSPTLFEMILLFGFFALFDACLTIFLFYVQAGGKGGWAVLLEGAVGLALSIFILVWSNLGSMLWPRVASAMLVYYIACWAVVTGLFKTLAAFRLREEVEGSWILGLGA
jgi:uncharacterized membrane protein HdeD (DUF308 family)